MEMTQQQALEVLVNAVKVAQKRGAFELEEAPIIAQAVAVFIPPQQPQPQADSGTEVTSENTEQQKEG